ncbi:hypothetical protein DL769_001395 [Monosporascus sp. CRB-8-3]|nr:hypothetical protein DL769_001395 [Monosporascus sp. CRB-8-3]
MSSSRRQRYTLGYGVYSGWITLDNGTSVWVEYLQDVVDGGASNLGYLQDALEYIAASVCEAESYNYIQIRSIFHSTTLRDGVRVQDHRGLHLTFTAANNVNDVWTGFRDGHAYIRGFDIGLGPERWYNNVELGRVRWEDQRGSSQGSRAPRSISGSAGGSTPSSSGGHQTSSRHSGRSRRSSSATGNANGDGGSSTAQHPDGWYPDPWGEANERWYASGQWTGHTR